MVRRDLEVELVRVLRGVGVRAGRHLVHRDKQRARRIMVYSRCSMPALSPTPYAVT